jgi:hypothetical protein
MRLFASTMLVAAAIEVAAIAAIGLALLLLR